MAEETEFIVARAAPDAPDGFLGDLEGKWYRRPDWRDARVGEGDQPGSVLLFPTGRFERRADGVRAEVFEARP